MKSLLLVFIVLIILIVLFTLFLFLLLSGLFLLLRFDDLFIKLVLEFSRIGVPGHEAFLGCEYFALNVGCSSCAGVVFLEQDVISLQHFLGFELLNALLDVEDLHGCAFVQGWG